MKYSTLLVALVAVFGLSACEKPTVVNVPPSPVAVPGPAVVVPGPAGPAGAPGSPGYDGAKGDPGKPGSETVVIVPVPENK